MRLYGLIGYPLSHSFSKRYFDEKFKQEGLVDCRFENFPIQSIEEFPLLLKQYPELKGLAVTIPYKQLVLKHLHTISGIPASLAACNCIHIQSGKLSGHNTDYIGFEKSIKPLLDGHHKTALVFGNGGAANAVVYALEQLGIGYQLVSRKIHGSSTLTYKALTESDIEKNTLLINTTPLGMYPDVNNYPPIPYEGISSQHLLYDLVYNPEMTVFLQKGKERGAIVKNGADMLVIQAEENWKIWNQ